MSDDYHPCQWISIVEYKVLSCKLECHLKISLEVWPGFLFLQGEKQYFVLVHHAASFFFPL